MAEEVVLMKGNEAIAHAAIRCGADGYFGYPITPQSEVLETLAELKPWETTGMVVLQAESEVAAINMVYGGAGSGKMVMTSSSSPGVSLKQEGISYLAGAELPCLIVNVMRGGPGLGTIQPSQADYFQTVKGGGHGDYRLIALAPASVQEMADFVGLAFELAFKYRNPAIILADGVIGQMHRTDDGESGAPARQTAPHRCRSHRPMPLGHHRQSQRPQTQHNHLARAEARRNGEEQHPLPSKIPPDRGERSPFRRNQLRRRRLSHRSLRLHGPYRTESNGTGPRRRYQSWYPASYHPLALPNQSYCRIRRKSERYAGD